MKIEIFGKPKCCKCNATKKRIAYWIDWWGLVDKIGIEFYDLKTPEGLAESAYNDISLYAKIPVVIIKENGREIKRYKEPPRAEEIRVLFNERGMQIQT